MPSYTVNMAPWSLRFQEEVSPVSTPMHIMPSPTRPFEISPQERRIRLTLKREKNCCIRNYRLYKHILFATIKGKKYVYQLDPLDKALVHPGHKSKNMKLVKTIYVKRAVSKLKGTKQGHEQHDVSKHKV